ncbi:helix-turn-helix transcriptional regulator [Tenggerimyces flavus]|uniref:AAA family ATPase n=1 Tax=Tenggerimyces flavus TaxID=1708749 RepID=A0ABV7Y831_9ACTN|nr:LuxR family transcriptional regulator [Tenggerimyces flavus]MBM7788254.1 DNA-binding CsgD family transcriptional regulator [Tenggerimyces flavus]
MDELIGREAELDRLTSFFATDDGPAALVVDGEAGIGKTSLWRAAVATARERGTTVLRCRPVEAEAPLAFAGLADLLADVADDVLAALPPPQRQALATALLRGDDEQARIDPRAVSAATLTALKLLAERASVLIAIDDVPWLDSSTERVLTFAIRRVDTLPIRILLARRTPAPAELPLGLDTAFPTVERQTLGPVNLRELQRLTQNALGRTLPRPMLVRVERASGGNPLYALEIVRALDRGGIDPKPGEPLPVAGRLRDLLADRIAALAPDERAVVLLAAASAKPTEALLRGQPGGTAAIERAEEAGLIELDGGRVTFTHPLMASTLYGDATATQRRHAHRTLAEAATVAEDRARHLALAIGEPDADVARALEQAAEGAVRRGAAAAATELFELAVHRTPPADTADRLRRQLALARHRFRDGDTPGAARLAQQVRAEAGHPSTQGEAALLLAEIEFDNGNADGAAALRTEALVLAADDLHLAARAHVLAASEEYEDLEAALAHAEKAIALLERLPTNDPQTSSSALQAYVELRVSLGLPYDRERAEEAVRVEEGAAPFRVSKRAITGLGAWLTTLDELDDARRALTEAYQAAVDEGDDSSVSFLLGHLARLDWRSGDWHRARELALESIETAGASGQASQRGAAIYLLGMLDAGLGDIDAARAEVDESLALASDLWERRRALWLQGFIELTVGDLRAARPKLEEAVELSVKMRLRHPASRQEVVDAAEVLVGLGERDRARELLDEHEEISTRLDVPTSRARAARGRGLLLAAEDDIDGAREAFHEALRQHGRVAVPFETGRTWLALGQLERRQRQKKLAQSALTEADLIFTALGARSWTERARDELSRVGLRSVKPGLLTETERRVAELAATGLTNRQVASELFISPRTVEAHIGRIYGKLGIRSRAELGRTLDALAEE